MEIIFDVRFFEELEGLPPWLILWEVFIRGGWIIFLVVLIWGIWKIWITKKQIKYLESQEYTLLAIDVPKENEQGPKAVEQIFAQLAAAENKLDFFEKNFQGIQPLAFSLEIISLGGYIQFLVRTPTNLRDLVESAIYAQYPDAEITEVDDYIDNITSEFPSEKQDLWGAELILYNKEAYPIRTYPFFEEPLERESFKDPMAALLEVLSKIGEGEQIWLQLLVVPCDADWKKQGDAEVKKLIGAKDETKWNLIDRTLMLPLQFLGWVHEQLWGPYGPSREKEAALSQMQFLSPGEKKVIEAIQNKISKIGFKTKFKMLYWGEKEVFSKGRGVAAVIGAIKQFNTLDMNGFKPDSKTKTAAKGLFSEKRIVQRQIRFLNNCQTRNFYKGAKAYVLNTEELATLFHFPVKTVKTLLLKKIELKKAEAPVSLPVEKEVLEIPTEEEKEILEEPIKTNNISHKPPVKVKSEPPVNLPTK